MAAAEEKILQCLHGMARFKSGLHRPLGRRSGPNNTPLNGPWGISGDLFPSLIDSAGLRPVFTTSAGRDVSL